MPGTQWHDLHVWTRLNDARAFMSSNIFSWPVLSRESSAIVIIIRRMPCRCTGLHIRSSSLFAPFSPWQCFNTLSVYSTRRNVFSTALNASELFSRQVFLRIDFKKATFWSLQWISSFCVRNAVTFPCGFSCDRGVFRSNVFDLSHCRVSLWRSCPVRSPAQKGKREFTRRFLSGVLPVASVATWAAAPGSSARRAWRNARPVVKSRRRHAGTEPLLFVVKFHVDFAERFCLISAS